MKFVTPSQLPVAYVSASHQQFFVLDDANVIATFKVTQGALPAGLTLLSGGLLTGVPTQQSVGKYSFTVQATDQSSGNTASATFQLEVQGPPLRVPPLQNPLRFPLNKPTPLNLTIQAGAPPYTIAPAGQLPAGFAWQAGSPPMLKMLNAGSQTLQLKVTDSSQPQQSVTFTLPLFGTSFDKSAALQVPANGITPETDLFTTGFTISIRYDVISNYNFLQEALRAAGHLVQEVRHFMVDILGPVIRSVFVFAINLFSKIFIGTSRLGAKAGAVERQSAVKSNVPGGDQTWPPNLLIHCDDQQVAGVRITKAQGPTTNHLNTPPIAMGEHRLRISFDVPQGVTKVDPLRVEIFEITVTGNNVNNVWRIGGSSAINISSNTIRSGKDKPSQDDPFFDADHWSIAFGDWIEMDTRFGRSATDYLAATPGGEVIPFYYLGDGAYAPGSPETLLIEGQEKSSAHQRGLALITNKNLKDQVITKELIAGQNVTQSQFMPGAGNFSLTAIKLAHAQAWKILVGYQNDTDSGLFYSTANSLNVLGNNLKSIDRLGTVRHDKVLWIRTDDDAALAAMAIAWIAGNQSSGSVTVMPGSDSLSGNKYEVKIGTYPVDAALFFRGAMHQDPRVAVALIQERAISILSLSNNRLVEETRVIVGNTPRSVAWLPASDSPINSGTLVVAAALPNEVAFYSFNSTQNNWLRLDSYSLGTEKPLVVRAIRQPDQKSAHILIATDKTITILLLAPTPN